MLFIPSANIVPWHVDQFAKMFWVAKNSHQNKGYWIPETFIVDSYSTRIAMYCKQLNDAMDNKDYSLDAYDGLVNDLSNFNFMQNFYDFILSRHPERIMDNDHTDDPRWIFQLKPINQSSKYELVMQFSEIYDDIFIRTTIGSMKSIISIMTNKSTILAQMTQKVCEAPLYKWNVTAKYANKAYFVMIMLWYKALTMLEWNDSDSKYYRDIDKEIASMTRISKSNSNSNTTKKVVNL